LTTTALYTHVAIDALVEVYERSHPAAKRPSDTGRTNDAT
jgi:site-specific recombinase XerC